MRKIIRSIYKNLLPKRISQSIDVFKHLRMAKVDALNERKVFVLSPHPDDDIVGCGGTLHLYHQKGAEITSIYMTDGRKGNPEYNEDDLVLIRKEEAKKAATMIGIDRLIFLGNRDTELSPSTGTIAELSAILKDQRPEAVFLPFMLDNHHDHIVTNDIFVRAAKDYYGAMMCYGYEIWTPLAVPNCIVDITNQIKVKIEALQQHRSQFEMLDFMEAVYGLSRYRCIVHMLSDKYKYAEAFSACSLSEYKRLWQVVR